MFTGLLKSALASTLLLGALLTLSQASSAQALEQSSPNEAPVFDAAAPSDCRLFAFMSPNVRIDSGFARPVATLRAAFGGADFQAPFADVAEPATGLSCHRGAKIWISLATSLTDAA